MAKNTILITGSKGLIGKALKDQLDSLSFQTIGMDIAYPSNHPEYGNFQDKKLTERLGSQCIGIVHLAGVSRVIAGERNPLLCWNTNVEGIRTVLEAIKSSPHNPWIIYASSREVYGQQDKLPVKEDVSLAPLNVYARSKTAAEELLLGHRKEGLQTAIIRFSNVYGSIHDYPDRVIPAFCRAAAFGGTLCIEGGQNIFDFTYIDDVVTGIIKVINRLQSGCRDLPTLHLVSGQGTTLLQAAELAKSFAKKSVKFFHASPRSFDVGSFYGDPGLASQVLGWRTETSLEQGMARLIENFSSELSRNASLPSVRV